MWDIGRGDATQKAEYRGHLGPCVACGVNLQVWVCQDRLIRCQNPILHKGGRSVPPGQRPYAEARPGCRRHAGKEDRTGGSRVRRRCWWRTERELGKQRGRSQKAPEWPPQCVDTARVCTKAAAGADPLWEPWRLVSPRRRHAAGIAYEDWRGNPAAPGAQTEHRCTEQLRALSDTVHPPKAACTHAVPPTVPAGTRGCAVRSPYGPCAHLCRALHQGDGRTDGCTLRAEGYFPSCGTGSTRACGIFGEQLACWRRAGRE